MASELLKNKALIQRLKEPEVPVVKFNLGETGFEELITLPEPKPQELLNIQEDVRIQRQQDTMDKARPFLMDESVDFIEREEKAIGGGLIEGTDLGTREGFQELFTRKGFSLAKAKRYEANKQKWMKANNATEEDFNKLGRSTQNRIRSTGNIYLSSDLENPKDFNVKRRDKNRKIAVDIIVKDMKEFYKTALPGEKYLLPKSLRSIVNVNNKTVKIPGNEETLEKYLINDLKKATDLKFERAGDPGVKNVPRTSTSLTKEQRDYYRKNYNKKSMSDIVRHFIGEGVGTSNLKYVNLYEKFKRFKRDLLNFKAIKEEDIVKVDPKKYSSDKVTKRVAQDLRNKILADLGVSGQENKLNRIQREIAEELYKPSAFIKDKLDRTYVPFDLAHRAGYAQFKKLGANYSISTLGPDLPEANRELVSVIENKLKPFYEEQVKLFNKGKKNLTKDLSKKIDANNNKIAEIIASEVETDPKIKGRVLGVQVDPYNLKVGTTPVDYTKSVDLGILDVAKIGTTGLDSKVKADIIARNYKELIKNIGQEQGFLKKKFIIPTEEAGQKKLTALQQLASGKNVGFDPILATRAGFEEFVKPAAKIGARGAATLADLAISAGPGAKGLGLGLLLEADPIITGMTEGKTFGQTARDTFVGSAIDAIPGVNLGSLNEDLLKLADTEEQKVGVQNVIDYQRDADRFKKRFENYKYLEDNPFEAEGVDLIAMEKSLLNDYLDLQSRRPKVQNPDVFSLLRELATKEAEKRKENLETGIQGLIFGDRMAKDPNFIENQIQQILAASTGVQGATDSYADAYKFLPQEQLTSDELDKRFDMEGGIMAANGGRIGFADGPMDPKRRLFMKIMGGIMSLPFIPKFMKQADVAKPIVKVAGSSTKMPDWFPNLINKVMFGGTGKKVDADLTIYEPKELPGISIGRYDDGRVFVEGTNEYGKKYQIEYEPPGFELLDEKTGKAVKTKGEFKAEEEVPVNIDPDGNADFDVEVLDDLDNIMGSDTRRMEEFATGKVTNTVKDMTGDTGMKKGEYNVGAAEARAEQAAEEAAERLADEAEEAAAALDEID